MATLIKIIKPISQDTASSDQPEGHPFYVKNGLPMEKMGTWMNEPGFLKSSISLPDGYTEHGIIATDKRIVFFSSNGISSEIGVYDPYTDTYKTVVNDPKFKFNSQKYITGKYRYNYLSQLEIAFTDNHEIPYTINIDKPADAVNHFEQYSLFPVARSPVFRKVSASTLVVSGGNLLSGTYYVLVRYRNNDYSETNYEISSQPIYIPGSGGIGAVPGTVTDWKIQLTLDGVDTSYDKIVIGLYSFTTANVATFNEILEIPIPPSTGPSLDGMKVVITGSEASLPLQLSEASVDTAWYDRVGTMTDLNGVLYISGLQRNPSYAFQSLANQITVRYISTTKDMTVPASNFSDPGEIYANKSFRHNEVYALYIAFHYKKGGYTRAFHIPGRPGTIAEKAASTAYSNNPFSQAQYSRYASGVPAYKVEDTSDAAPIILLQNGTIEMRGQLGYWENDTEIYPYDAVTWGALAGTPVRHHRFPSIRNVKGLIAGAFPQEEISLNYGKTSLDTLGIEVSNIQIPPELASTVDGYQIYFAKRTLGNSCVIAQSLYMCGTTPNPVDASIRSTGFNGNVTSFGGSRITQRRQDGSFYDPIITPGMNYNADGSIGDYVPPHKEMDPTATVNFGFDWLAGPNLDTDVNSTDRKGEGLHDVTIDYNYMRFHSFDLLSQATPMAVNPDYIWNDLSYPFDDSFTPLYYGDNHSPNNGSGDSHSDIRLDVFNNRIYGFLDSVFSIAVFDYTKSANLPSIVSEVDVVRNVSPSKTYYVPNHTVVDQVHNILTEGCLALQLNLLKEDPSNVKPFGAFPTAANHTMLTSLMRLVDDAYYGFARQHLASCGDMQPITGATTVATADWFGADTFIAMYGFNTYTGDVIRLLNTAKDFLNGTNNTGTSVATYIGDQIGGRYSHYFIGEFSENPQLRHEDLTNPYSKFYPRSKGAQITVKLQRSIDPNQIQYNRDYNRVADIRVPLPFDPYFVEVSNFPYRIARGGRQQAEARSDNWRAFLPLDYYESSKNYGPIINLGTYDFNLIIHHKSFIRITKDRATLNATALSVVLGSGNIFELDPTTPVPYEHGYGGTNHNLGCYTTPAGYVFLDADVNVGNMFLFDGKLRPISSGLMSFLRDHLALIDKNVYLGNGIMICYDPKYRRIMVVVKNKKLPASLQASYAGELSMDDLQMSTLIPGTSIVQYQGTYYTYIS